MSDESSDGAAGWQEQVSQLLVEKHQECLREVQQLLSWKFPTMPLARREDIALEAFARTAHKWLREPDLVWRDPVPYARIVGRNLAVDSLREKSAVPTCPHDLDQVTVPHSGPDDSAALLADVVIPAIRRMPRTQRRAVVELQSRGADDTLISAELGIPRRQVQVQRSRAIRELRSKLKDHIRLKAERNRQRRGEGGTGE